MPYDVADWITATDITGWIMTFAGITAAFAVIYISIKQIAIQKRQVAIQEAQVDFQRQQINIMKLQADITRKLTIAQESRKSIEKEHADTDLQQASDVQQASAVNIAMRQWETIQANLTAQIELRLSGAPNGYFLLVRNEGPADARNVSICLDGRPMSKHRNVRTSLSDNIRLMAAGTTVEYSLNLGSDDLHNLSLDMNWTDGSSEPRHKSTTLGVF